MTAPERPDVAPAPTRPPRIALVVVAVIGLVVLGLFLYSAQTASGSMAESLMDEDEELVGPGEVEVDLGAAVLTGELSEQWVQHERCPGWVQFTSTGGDATTLHVIASTGVPDLGRERLVAVDDQVDWLAREVGVRVSPSESTTLLGAPAVRGPLVADADAPEEALLAACREDDDRGGTGIRGPAAGFEQYLVATRGPVGDLGTVLVLGAAWVDGDIGLASREARGLAASLTVVD